MRMHTPGPWIVTGGLIGDGRAIEAYSGYGAAHTVARAELPPFGSREEQREANAALIAAAPDLLTALTACMERLAIATEKHFTGYVGDDKLIFNARAAIAKAKGEE